jgi:hypothetical protein
VKPGPRRQRAAPCSGLIRKLADIYGDSLSRDIKGNGRRTGGLRKIEWAAKFKVHLAA